MPLLSSVNLHSIALPASMRQHGGHRNSTHELNTQQMQNKGSYTFITLLEDGAGGITCMQI